MADVKILDVKNFPFLMFADFAAVSNIPMATKTKYFINLSLCRCEMFTNG